MIAALPSPAPVLYASCGSRMRQFAGYSPAWEIARTARAAGAEARPVLQPHPRLGDHAEDALRADEQPVRAGPGARAGQPPRLHHPTRRDHAQAFDEIVNMRVEAGEMPARARRDPAAERRVLEALREMPQRQPVWPQ